MGLLASVVVEYMLFMYIQGIKIMTGRGKRGGKRQNKKKNNSTREKVQEHNPAPIAEEFSGGNETQTDHHSATSQVCLLNISDSLIIILQYFLVLVLLVHY